MQHLTHSNFWSVSNVWFWRLQIYGKMAKIHLSCLRIPRRTKTKFACFVSKFFLKRISISAAIVMAFFWTRRVNFVKFYTRLALLVIFSKHEGAYSRGYKAAFYYLHKILSLMVCKTCAAVLCSKFIGPHCNYDYWHIFEKRRIFARNLRKSW